ncbi:MAG: radical SAM protein [Clostridiales bacterium]|nr:radical SAM protein [Clostridiales bacterium]
MRKFKRIYIETTNICNLNCDFCPKTSRSERVMSIEDFEIIINKIKHISDHIYLHLMGEPLINPKLESFLKIANDNDIKVNITTNGTLLNKNTEVLINSKAVRQINISLHSFEGNNNNIDFYEYINKVLEFVNLVLKNTDIIVGLRLWNFDSLKNKGNNKLNKDIIQIIKSFFNYEEDILENLNRDKRIKLQNKLYLNSAEKFSWPDINISSLGNRGFCHGLRDHFGILCDGTVVPCCLDSEGNIPLGNIFEDSIENIINGDRALNIYNGFSNRNRVEALCKRCGYSEKFNK